MAQIRALDALQIVVFRDASVLRAHVRSGVLVCAFCESANLGGAALVPAPTAASLRPIIRELVKKVSVQSGQPAGEVRLKLLSSGASEFGHLAETIIGELGFVQVGHAHEEFATEAYFYTSTGRLRIASAGESAAEMREEAAPKRKTRVLVVDDSKTIRQLLTRILTADPELEVIGTADCPSQAEKMIRELRPDVITLDIHMPEMDGVSFLQKYIGEFPIPTVMISSISMEESTQVLQALEIGAVDYIQKPSFEKLDRMAPLIAEMVRTAATVKVRRSAGTKVSHARIQSSAQLNQSVLVAVGASTGGTEALRLFLSKLPPGIPPIVIVQHIPPVFSKAFANRLASTCPFEVKEAEDGDLIRPDRVLIAPGGLQMAVQKGSRVRIWDGDPVNRHKPSVDVLFKSVAEIAGSKSIGIIMTGMGRDGAAGLLEMKQSGSRTIAQDEASSVVFGMPKEAIRLGAAQEVMPLDRIPEKLLSWLEQGRRVQSQG